jgi:hypothetical protein
MSGAPELVSEQKTNIIYINGVPYVLKSSFMNYLDVIWKQNDLTDDEKELVAIVAAEAGAENELSWKAVTYVIMNRLKNKRDVWKDATSVKDVISDKTQFNGFGSRNYNLAKDYLKERDGSNEKYERIIQVVMSVYSGRDGSDFTKGAVLFYSPKSMNPPGSRPSWNFDFLDEVVIEGIDSNAFRFYKYK